MTLGGLALAIGLLVDNATVTIENIHRNQSLGKPLTVAILDGSARGDPAADRGDAGDLHRVLPGRAAVRRGALPVHSARRHRRVLHAGVLRPVVHRGAGVRALPAGRRGAAPRTAARLLRRCSIAASTGSATAMAGCWKARCTAACSCWSAPACCWCVSGGLATVIGLDFFPTADVGLIKLHYPRPARHAARADRGTRAAGRGQHPQDHSRRRAGHHQRHGRRAVLVQSGVRAERQCRRDGRRDPDLAQARAPPVDRLHPRHPRQAARRVPRQHLLFPDRRHRQPGAEFRPVGADRRADPGRELRPRHRRWAGKLLRAHAARSPAWPTRTWCRC